MTDISRTNFQLIEKLKVIMESNHLTIVGYSGRDIDIFPFIRDLLGEPKTRRIFWINGFRNRNSLEHYRVINLPKTDIIYSYPRMLFENARQLSETRNHLRERGIQLPRTPGTTSFDAETIVNAMKQELIRHFPWKSLDRTVFLAYLMTERRMFSQAQFVFRWIRRIDGAMNSLSLTQRACMLKDMCNNAHNLSSFPEMKDAAEELLKLSEEAEKGTLDYYGIIARSVLAEYTRMQVPFGTFVFGDLASAYFRPELVQAYYYSLEVGKQIERKLREDSMGRNLAIDMRRVSKRRRVAAVHAEHELIEFQFRRLSLVALLLRDVLDSDGEDLSKMLQGYLRREIEFIERLSQRNGYALGLVNSFKFRSRVFQDFAASDFKSRAQHIINLLNMETARDIFEQLDVEMIARTSDIGIDRLFSLGWRRCIDNPTKKGID